MLSTSCSLRWENPAGRQLLCPTTVRSQSPIPNQVAEKKFSRNEDQLCNFRLQKSSVAADKLQGGWKLGLSKVTISDHGPRHGPVPARNDEVVIVSGLSLCGVRRVPLMMSVELSEDGNSFIINAARP